MAASVNAAIGIVRMNASSISVSIHCSSRFRAWAKAHQKISQPQFGMVRSAFASYGHTCAKAYNYSRDVPILLQKSFSTADPNFSSPQMRFADKYAGDLVS
jgi:hypothetical protein